MRKEGGGLARIFLDRQNVECAVYSGAVLGGWIEEGLQIGCLAVEVGQQQLVTIN